MMEFGPTTQKQIPNSAKKTEGKSETAKNYEEEYCTANPSETKPTRKSDPTGKKESE